MSRPDIFLILLSLLTIAVVVLALKTSYLIEDKAERAHKAICFLVAIIGGFIFSNPLGGILIGAAKESFEITLAIHRNLFDHEKWSSSTSTFGLWIIGGFFGAEALEPMRSYIFTLSLGLQ